MKQTYSYPAVFHMDHVIGIDFPDFPGCLPCGDDMEEAMRNAKEAMCLHLFGLLEDGEPIPEPSPVECIKLSENRRVIVIGASLDEVQGRP